MGIEQAFNDRTLLDVVSLLSSRNESGRLKIAGGTMRGAFFFSKGKLVDAHMGPFSGFQAVNLAISVGKARLSFDPSIESKLSSFKVPAERLVLKERFGIETEVPMTSESEARKTNIETNASETSEPDMTVTDEKLLVASPPPPQPALPRAAVLPPQAKAEIKEELESVIRQVRETTIRRVLAKTRLVPRGLRVDSLSRRGLVISLILLIVIPTTASLAAYLRNSQEIGAPDSSAGNPTVTSPAPLAASAPSQPEEKLTTPLPDIERVPLRPQPSPAAVETPIEKSETNRLNPPPAKDNEVAERIEDSKVEVQPVESSARSSSRTVAIVVEIEAGRVTEAFVQRPQQGLAAYEATALRLARQRRFAKGKTGRETITLHVTREP